jgi:uncharacterized protein involved in exopolysaccharide biosynthesis
MGDRSEADSAARLRSFGDALRRSRLFLVVWTLVWIGFGAAYLISVRPEFVARVDVALEPRRIANDGPEDERHFHQFALDSEQADTELRVLRSERLLRPIFDQFHLADTPELADRSDGFWQGLARWLHRFAPNAMPYDGDTRAFFAFTSRVHCLRLGLSYVFEISYRSNDANTAAQVANAIAAGYVADRLVTHRARLDRVGGPYRVAVGEALSTEIDKAREAALHGSPAPEDLPLADVRVLGAAAPPLSKTYPKPGPMLLFAAGFAMISGVMLVLLARVPASARRDRRANERQSMSQRPRFSL